MPFRTLFESKRHDEALEWCRGLGIHCEIIAGEPGEDIIDRVFSQDEYRFSTEEDLLKFHEKFQISTAWVEAANGRHIPLEAIPPSEHKPDRFLRKTKRPPVRASSGWDPNRSLTWKQRARMAREALRLINSMFRPPYRKRPAFKLDQISGLHEGPFFLFEISGRKFLIFVQAMFPRVAPYWETIPGVLDAEARKFLATPFVVFVDPDRESRFAGFAALEKAIKNLPEWRMYLLHGKTPQDFMGMRRARISEVEFRAEIQMSEDFFHRPLRFVEALMLVNGEPIGGLSLSSGQLLASLAFPDQRDLLNCSCGISGCAGIKFGCVTCEQDGLMMVKVYSAAPPRLLLFEASQYRESAIKCLNRLVNLDFLQGTQTVLTLVRPDCLKSLACELDIPLNYED